MRDEGVGRKAEVGSVVFLRLAAVSEALPTGLRVPSEGAAAGPRLTEVSGGVSEALVGPVRADIVGVLRVGGLQAVVLDVAVKARDGGHR